VLNVRYALAISLDKFPKLRKILLKNGKGFAAPHISTSKRGNLHNKKKKKNN